MGRLTRRTFKDEEKGRERLSSRVRFGALRGNAKRSPRAESAAGAATKDFGGHV